MSDKKTSNEQLTTLKIFGSIAPKFSQLSDDGLFADAWERVELSKRDRSLITIVALI